MKKLFVLLFCLLLIAQFAVAQEYFTISQYDVSVKVNKDASLDVDETINANFDAPRHGIFRKIPYKYQLMPLPAGTEKAQRQLESDGYTHTIIEDISVDNWDYDVSTDGDYKVIKIGSADNLVDGAQTYVIHYRILNAINFFADHSELYFNVIGDGWPTTIDHVNFSISFYDAVKDTTEYFVATGSNGSRENNTISSWKNDHEFSGETTVPLNDFQGVTVGISLPKDFLTQQNYSLLGFSWMLLPVAVFFGALLIWKRWGKDDKPTVQTEFYPPQNISPAISGYLIDDILQHRDLTALVPYWGAGGYLKVKETETKALLGLVKNKEYTFIKVKDLPSTAPDFEQTLFNGIFDVGDTVELSSLKNVLYKTMAKAKSQVEAEIKKDEYYVKGSDTNGCLLSLVAIGFLIAGLGILFAWWNGYMWCAVAFIVSAVITFVFAALMRKKTPKGTLLYQKLLGFKEFLQLVEKDRLKEFLKQDENYFDKVLPYAIVFGIADSWKDKLEGLDVPPPRWYSGNYNTFNTYVFMSSLNNSMNQMSSTFYSAPSSSGSSGGSFGGGGFSGGGFGGGGGGSW